MMREFIFRSVPESGNLIHHRDTEARRIPGKTGWERWLGRATGKETRSVSKDGDEKQRRSSIPIWAMDGENCAPGERNVGG